MATMPKYGGAK